MAAPSNCQVTMRFSSPPRNLLAAKLSSSLCQQTAPALPAGVRVGKWLWAPWGGDTYLFPLGPVFTSSSSFDWLLSAAYHSGKGPITSPLLLRKSFFFSPCFKYLFPSLLTSLANWLPKPWAIPLSYWFLTHVPFPCTKTDLFARCWAPLGLEKTPDTPCQVCWLEGTLPHLKL